MKKLADLNTLAIINSWLFSQKSFILDSLEGLNTPLSPVHNEYENRILHNQNTPV